MGILLEFFSLLYWRRQELKQMEVRRIVCLPVSHKHLPREFYFSLSWWQEAPHLLHFFHPISHIFIILFVEQKQEWFFARHTGDLEVPFIIMFYSCKHHYYDLGDLSSCCAFFLYLALTSTSSLQKKEKNINVHPWRGKWRLWRVDHGL